MNWSDSKVRLGFGGRVRFKELMAAACLLVPAQAHAAWQVSSSRHFVVYGDASPEWLRKYSMRLEKFDQAVRILRDMDDPPPGESGRVTIFMLPDTDAVSKLVVGKRSSLAGVYMPRASGSIAFVPHRAGSEDWNLSAEGALFHEYAHHLMFQSTEQAYPPWLVEGIAEFFTNVKFEGDDTVRLALPANHRAYVLDRLERPPMEMLLGPGLGDNANALVADSFYGWSWLLTHYLTFDDERTGQLADYTLALRKGADPLEAARQVFGDIDKLGVDAERYLRHDRFRNIAVKHPPPAAAGITVRKLRDGEAAMMPIVLKSRRGVDTTTAPAVAADARKIAAAYPGDPAVLRALAEAEFDAGNLEAAEKAATRATEIDPNFAAAWIYRGRAQMELANETTTESEWEKIRASFLKANALDKENAEPLWLFYQSFPRSGRAPNQNAVSALDYALVLAPQDQGLRMTAAMQRLRDKKLPEARAALSVLAFSPHPGSLRDAARRAIVAIDAKDGAGANVALSGARDDNDKLSDGSREN